MCEEPRPLSRSQDKRQKSGASHAPMPRVGEPAAGLCADPGHARTQMADRNRLHEVDERLLAGC
jgi:hypothetical protein